MWAGQRTDLEAVPFFKSLVRLVAFVRSCRVPDMVLRLDDVVRAGGVGGQFCPRLARGEFADGGCGKENCHRPPCARFPS